MQTDLKLEITVPAYNDLLQIFNYIAGDDYNAAVKIIEIFEKRFENIRIFPEIGFKPKYSKRSIRVSIVAKHYQIIYFVKDKKLIILRVLTGYQNINDSILIDARFC